MPIREIAPDDEGEIDLVAQRMRDTLIEVEGPEVGGAMYSMDWLRDRVRWHLDPSKVLAKVYLALSVAGDIVGHTIVRRETGEAGAHFGLVSTTYVIPASRRDGVAQQLLEAGERWMESLDLPSSSTWTSTTNAKLIGLYEKNGYRQVEQHVHAGTGTLMVRLEKRLQ
jgi:GNAT superfamily N-acetyltransferase